MSQEREISLGISLILFLAAGLYKYWAYQLGWTAAWPNYIVGGLGAILVLDAQWGKGRLDPSMRPVLRWYGWTGIILSAIMFLPNEWFAML